MYFGCLGICAVLFATQFLFNQSFEKECGSSLTSSLLFSFYTSVLGFCVLLLANGFKITFSYFSCIIALIYAVVGILYTVASVRSFEYVNLSAYSVFAMLGGMLLPSVYGIVFCREEITLTKIICYALIAAALFFEIDIKQEAGKKYITSAFSS